LPCWTGGDGALHLALSQGATGGLDDTQLRLLEDRLRYLRELEDRRAAIIQSITEQNKMTPELLTAISLAADKTHLEDLYLPYKQKRRTKVQIAQEAGLEPLADALLANPMLNPDEEAAKFLREPFATEQGDNPGVADAKAALDGARQILMERFSEDAPLLQWLREYVQEHGIVESRVREGKESAAEKVTPTTSTIPNPSTPSPRTARWRYFAAARDMLDVRLRLDSEEERPAWSAPHNPARHASPAASASRTRAAPRPLADGHGALHLAREELHASGTGADGRAARPRRDRGHQRLRAQPQSPVAGRAGRAARHDGARPRHPHRRESGGDGRDRKGAGHRHHLPAPTSPTTWDGSLHTLARLAEKHKVSVISIGNGTASRETDKLARDLIKLRPELKLTSVVVSEAGASVYSASEFASRELPTWTSRCARGLHRAPPARPLAELVKIDPKSIGVGQVPARRQPVPAGAFARCGGGRLRQRRGCRRQHSSVPLLARVSGLSSSVAQAIVTHREIKGRFASRAQLLDVPRLGAKTFEAGGGLPAHHGRQRPARRLRRPPRIVSAGASDPRRHQAGPQSRDRPTSSLLKSLDPAKYRDREIRYPTITGHSFN